MKKEKDLSKVTDLASGEYLRAITSDGESVLIKKSDLLTAVSETSNGLMTIALFAKAFKGASLPGSGVNVVGNIDAQPSGYGWFNNSNGSTSENAPARKAGLFVRFLDQHWTVTLFFTMDYQLWWKTNSEDCKQVLNVGK